MRTLALLAALALAPAPALAQPPAAARPAAAAKAPDVAEHLRARIDSILTILGDDQRYEVAVRELNKLWDQALAYASPKDEELLADVVYHRQAIAAISRLKREDRAAAFALLRQHPDLGRTLIFAMHRGDQPRAVFDVLIRLHQAHGDRIAAYPNLTAALCIVHDEPLRYAATNEPVDPAALFDYFTRNEGRLSFGLKNLPAEILAYMVNSRATIPEMEWALSKHAGDRNVGKRFNDLVYDTAHFKYNKPKRIEGHPYTLENLRKFGGICGDQAYFAAHVGKSIGIPTAEVAGRGSDIGHAWVGFLQRRGSAWVFNCEEGIFGEYEKLRAATRDPQGGAQITQSQVELLMRMADSTPADRFAAAALLESARRLRESATTKGVKWPPDPEVAGAQPTRASADAATQMALLERAAAILPASPAVWTTAVEWAADMQVKERDAWFRAINKASERISPDFAYAITCSLIAATPDQKQQLAAWDWLRKQYPRRPDLACGSLHRKGNLLAAMGDKNAALAAYSDAAKTYCNNGPFFLNSLDRADALLREIERIDLLADLYGDVFRRTSRPSSMSDSHSGHSNYHKVGERYLAVLLEAGRTREAEQLRKQLGLGPVIPSGR